MREKDIINFINLKKFYTDLGQRFLMGFWMLALWKGKKCCKYGALDRADKNQLCVLLTSILFHSNSILWFYDLLRPKLVKGLNPTLTIIKAANIGRYFQFGPILNRMCEITIPQSLNLKRKVIGQCFRTFIWGFDKIDDIFWDLVTFTILGKNESNVLRPSRCFVPQLLRRKFLSLGATALHKVCVF